MTMGAKREEIAAPRATSAARRGLPAGEDALRCLVLMALIAGFAFATRGATISGANIANVLLQSAITGIAACGQALVVLTARLDLSVSGVVALSMIIGGSLITAPLSPFIALPAMILVAAAFGLVNGCIVPRFRLPALVVTLGSWQVGNGLAYQVTGKGFVDHIPLNIAAIGQGQILAIPIPVIVFFTIVALSYFLLHRTPFGAESVRSAATPRLHSSAACRSNAFGSWCSQSLACSMALAPSSACRAISARRWAGDRP